MSSVGLKKNYERILLILSRQQLQAIVSVDGHRDVGVCELRGVAVAGNVAVRQVRPTAEAQVRRILDHILLACDRGELEQRTLTIPFNVKLRWENELC